MKPGRKPKLDPEQFAPLWTRYKNGESPGDIAADAGVDHSTLLNFFKQHVPDWKNEKPKRVKLSSGLFFGDPE